MELFTIQCTTCRARLVVHDEAVIGDILACPKCSSMVHVVPPVGWNSGTVEAAPHDPSVWPPTGEPSPAASRPAKTPKPAKAKAAAVIPPALPPRPAPAPTVAASPVAATPPPVLAAAKVASQPPLPMLAANAVAVPPPVPTVLAVASSVAIGRIASKSVADTNLSATHWTKLTNWARQEWRFLAGGVGTGIALGGSVWLVLLLQAPSAPLVADLASDAQPPVAKAAEPAPVAAVAPLAAEASAIPAAEVEEANANKALPEGDADKLAVEPRGPVATTAPIAAAPVDKPETAQPPQVKVQPAATGEKTPPVASAPRPTIKLEPVPAASADATLPAEAASILDTDAADGSPETPAVVRTPAAESPGAERPTLTAAEVDERLSRGLPAAQFTKVPLFKFIEFVAEFTTLPIQLDEPALKRAGMSRQSAVTVKLSETTAGDALRAALSDLGLVTVLRSGVVIVTVASDAKGAE